MVMVAVKSVVRVADVIVVGVLDLGVSLLVGMVVVIFIDGYWW